MGQQAWFHAPHGGADFLAMRKNRNGSTEIVYDDGVACRIIWRVEQRGVSDECISDALRASVAALRVVPTLYDELKKRSIVVERLGG